MKRLAVGVCCGWLVAGRGKGMTRESPSCGIGLVSPAHSSLPGTDTPVLDRVVGREGGRGKHRSPLKVVSNKVC
jgi:hypothetical protein